MISRFPIICAALVIVVITLATRSAYGAAGVAGGESGHPLMAPGYAVEYLSGVVIVMLALGAFAFGLRRLQGRVGGGQDGLRVRASLSLGGKERLVVVQVRNENLLLGVSPGSVQLVSKLAPDTDDASQPVTSDSWLARTLNRDATERPRNGESR